MKEVNMIIQGKENQTKLAKKLEVGETFVYEGLKYIRIEADSMVKEEYSDEVLAFCLEHSQIHSIPSDNEVKVKHLFILI